ncbi:MAG TPA: sigma-70 family RNA polymerase sigma factor [Verrucomicrobiae bacterium]
MNLLEQGERLELTDGQCVQRSRDGSPEDFRLLVQRYQRPLFAYISGRLSDQLEAEELAQESFVRAFVSLKKLRQPDSFYAWLLGIAGRVLKENFRALQRRDREQAAAETLVADEQNTEEEYSLEAAIALLPETYRRVILLRYYEGLSCQEIAARLEIPLGTVTKTLSRAYALLRQELQAQENADSPPTRGMSHELH